jgi:O-antigen/teichoic acid export membrane protein
VINQLKLKHGFGMNILTTMSGAAISQIIPIFIIPILTRLYSPSDFGVFSLYISLATICSVIATARYEVAIMLPKRDWEAINLVVLSLIISGLTSLFFLSVIYIFHQRLLNLIGNPLIDKWLFAIPITVFFTGIFQSLIFWCNRKKQFSKVAAAKIYQGASLSGCQLALSPSKTAYLGLISGYIFGLIISTIYLFKIVWNKDAQLLNHVSKARVISSLVKYKNFPLYSLWGTLFDAAAVQMPIFMLSKFYDSDLTGIFSLTFRALNLPMVLIAASISQVLFQKISHLNNTKPELLNKLIIKLFLMLLVTALPFLFILFFWGPQLFSLVFGPEWALSGKYASTIVFAIVMRFAISPLSNVLALEHNLKLGFAWQVSYFCTISIILFIAAKYAIDTFILAFVIHEIILYLLYLYLILLGTKRYQYNQPTKVE